MAGDIKSTSQVLRHAERALDNEDYRRLRSFDAREQTMGSVKQCNVVWTEIDSAPLKLRRKSSIEPMGWPTWPCGETEMMDQKARLQHARQSLTLQLSLLAYAAKLEGFAASLEILYDVNLSARSRELMLDTGATATRRSIS